MVYMLMCMNNNYCTYLDEVLTAENCILEENCELHKSSFLVIRLFQESLTWCWNHVSAMSKMLHVHPGHVDEDFSFGQKLHLWKYFQCCDQKINTICVNYQHRWIFMPRKLNCDHFVKGNIPIFVKGYIPIFVMGYIPIFVMGYLPIFVMGYLPIFVKGYTPIFVKGYLPIE